MSTALEHETVLTLPAVAPFSFARTLGFVCGFAPTRGQQEAGDGRLVAALRAEGRTVLATVTSAEDADGAGAAGVRVALRADRPVPDEVADAAADRITSWLSLDDDLTGFYALARDDASFWPVVERLYGYHQVRFPSPWENVVWAILTQRTPMPVAQRAKQALTEHVGNAIVADGRTWWAFPDAAQVAALDPAVLRDLVGNDRKATYLHASAQRWTALDERELRSAPYDSVRELLLGLPGIGPWSASFVLIRGLGRMEEVSPDREMLRAASRAYGVAVGEADLARLAERYGVWAGYWAHYLRAGS
ncbi:DNA-3-methyladenine glycosylase [Cellulomonas cellasea]|uniref:DNA-3-methyladenine glycosylase II n=1 Tax=Cellulomonas cellasea TaxID=43670 RepID=A0A7W4UIF6_9CELL|nr:DNA-3-methyladenine glycosylase 2 family protein [Cellulomonas cellasea]MBB2924123.1 DNA-3-methyladenine glycosylase II [Cellulomonas cellasea]